MSRSRPIETSPAEPETLVVPDLADADAFRIAGRRFYPALRRVEFDDKIQNLEPKVFAVLTTLASHAGQVVSRQQFFDTVWPETAVEEGVLFRAVSELRRLFDDDPHQPQVIETIRARGYRLIETVSIEQLPEGVLPAGDAVGAAGAAGAGDSVGAPDEPGRHQDSPESPAVEAVEEPSGKLDRKPVPLLLWVVAGLAVIAVTASFWSDRAAGDGEGEGTAALPSIWTSLPGAEVQPTISPDGTSLAYCWYDIGSNGRQLHVWDTHVNEPTRLDGFQGSAGFPSWSPAGDLAFWRLEGGGADLLVSPAQAGPLRALAVDKAGVGSIAWAPDGKSLWTSFADVAGRAIQRIDLESGHVEQVTHPLPGGEHDAAVAVNGRGDSLAFVRRQTGSYGQIWVLDLESGQTRQVLSGISIDRLAWLPDRPVLVFGAYHRDRRGLWAFRLGQDEPTWLGLDNASEPAVSLDGRTVAFSQGDYRVDLWQLDLQTGETSVLVESSRKARYPALDPSGTRLAFSSTRDGDYSIWVAGVDGSNPRKLAGGDSYASRPAWSPDGRRLAFEANSYGQLDIFVADEQGRPRRLTDHPAAHREPAWSADGRTVYFASTQSGAWQIWRIDADEAEDEDGGRAELLEGTLGYRPRPTPDGRWVIYRDLSTRLLARIAVEGGPVELLHPGTAVSDWTLDEAGRLLFTTAGESGIFRFDPDTGVTEKLFATSTAGPTLEPGDRDLQVAADRLVFSRSVSVEKDVYTIPADEILRRLDGS